MYYMLNNLISFSLKIYSLFFVHLLSFYRHNQMQSTITYTLFRFVSFFFSFSSSHFISVASSNWFIVLSFSPTIIIYSEWLQVYNAFLRMNGVNSFIPFMFTSLLLKSCTQFRTIINMKACTLYNVPSNIVQIERKPLSCFHFIFFFVLLRPILN